MNNDIIILTIEIYIAGVKNRAGFATELNKNVENQSNHNNVLYVVFYYLSNDTSGFC